MKKALIALWLFLIALCAYANDTVINKPVVTLDSDLSQYNSVVVEAIESIVMEPGFECSGSYASSFTLVNGLFQIDEPDLTMTPGTMVEQSGTLDGGYLVGAIPGQAGVSPSGAATYSIPIEVPVGNKGMVPRLSVGYNSQGGNGLMGRGWNLGGISSISATGKTRYYDNESTAISSIDTACRVVWDGQRLLALNNAGLEADSFRTEMASNVNITTTGSGNTMWFRVETPDGHTMEYGNTTDSRLALDDSTQWKWMLNKVYDRNGNTIVYTYTKDESVGEVLLSEIEYGGTTASPVNTITFHYTNRSDISYAYIHDDLVLHDQLLDSIFMESNSDYYGSYGFHYSTTTGESLLDEIVQYDKDNYRFNATTVSWESPTLDTAQIAQNQDIESGAAYYQFTGDFTGDGIFDLVACELNPITDTYTYDMYIGTSSGLPSSPDISHDLPRSYIYQWWSIFTDYIEIPGGCNYGVGPPALASYLNRQDVSYVLSGDFDGDGIEELFVKVMDWEELTDYLPEDLDDGFDNDFYTDYGGFLDDICSRSESFTGNGPNLNSSIGYIINLDQSTLSPERQQSFRMGDSYIYDIQYSQLPDIAGMGYNSFPFDNSLAYYDPTNDEVVEYCSIYGDDQRWAEFNGDGKADYIDPANTTFSVYTYNESTNSYSSSSEDGYFLGTIDLNGDGISAWVALGDQGFETLTYYTYWTEWCSENGGGSLDDNDDWVDFLSDYDSNLEEDYYDGNGDPIGCTADDYSCRMSYLNSNTYNSSLGYELYAKHVDNRGPEISFGYYPGTHDVTSPLLTRAIEADIDTDGKNDLLIFSGSILKTIYYDFEPSYSGGNITYDYESVEKNLLLSDNIHLGDFNGDGITEMIFPNADKSLCFITAGKPGKLVSSVQNGLGVESRFSYTPLTESDVYTKESDASFPVIDFKAPWYVVSGVTSDNGVADSMYIGYKYEGAKIHLQGKGFLGYMKTTIENDLLNTSQISTMDYEDTFFQTYPDSLLRMEGGDSVQLSKSYVSIDSLDVHKFRVKTDSVQIQNFLSGTNTTTAYKYNNNGLVEEKETNVDGLATITENYTYTSAGWHVATKPEYISKTYDRGGSTETDSSYMSYSPTTGNLTQKKLFCGTDREVTTKLLIYDSFGNPTRQSVAGKRGQSLAMDSIVTNLTYTTDGRFLTSKSAPLYHKETYDWDLSTGVPESQTASNRTTTTHEYGPFLRKKKTIGANYTEAASAIQWAADRPDDAPTGSLYYKWGEVSGTPEVVSYFDEVGRELRTVTRGFDDELIYTDTEYDTKGRTLKKSLPYFSGDTTLWTTYSYDSYGRVLTETALDTTLTTYTYDDTNMKVTTTISKASNTYTSSTIHNAFGEVTESEDNLNNVVYNKYLPDGKLDSSYVSTHSIGIRFTYDAQGNRTSIKDPDAGTITSLYDAFGQLLRQINAKDDTTTYQYDAIGRATTTNDARGDIYYSYISDTTSVAFGMVDSMHNSDHSLQEVYTYDSDFGRLLTLTKTSPGKSFTNSFAYDWYGRPMSRTYPSDFEIEYSYTSNGDLNQITGEGLTLWSCSDVNALGQITSYSQGNYSTAVSYNSVGRLSNVTTGSIVNMNYDFNDFGNLISREDDITNQEEVFSYDDLNRLTDVDYYYNDIHNTQTIVYDNCGNITSKTGISTDIDYGEIPAGPHALTTINDPDASYTPPPQAISYNCFNKVSSITDTLSGNIPLSISFDYGMNNQRIKTTTTRNSTVERVKYFDMDYEEDSTTVGVKKYHFIHGGNGLTAIFVKEGSGNDTMYHVLSDHLGSLTTIVNATTDEVKKYSYNAWGIPRDSDDWTSEYTGELFTGRGFTGHEHLTEFNLINMNGRIYDPVVGRFLSPDPFVQAPQYPNNYNRYSYALNNPLRFIDPSGYYNKPSPLERDRRNGQGAYYNYEMAWKLGGNRTPFASIMANSVTGGWVSDGAGGVYNRFTGERASGSDFRGDFISSIVDPSQYTFYEWGIIGTSGWEERRGKELEAYAKPVYGWTESNPASRNGGDFLSSASEQDFDGFWGGLKYFWTGGNLDGYHYNMRGEAVGLAPVMGVAPSPGKAGLKGGYSVYQGLKNGKIVYWGLTKNLTRRAADHAGRFDNIIEVYSGMNKQAARGLEQMMIDKHGINALENIRNGVGINNPRMMQYYQEAIRYLQGLSF